MKNTLNTKSTVILISAISALTVGGYMTVRYIKSKMNCCMDSQADSDESDILSKSFACEFSSKSCNDGPVPVPSHPDAQEAAEPSVEPSPAEKSVMKTNLPTSPIDMDSDLYRATPPEEVQSE